MKAGNLKMETNLDNAIGQARPDDKKLCWLK